MHWTQNLTSRGPWISVIWTTTVIFGNGKRSGKSIIPFQVLFFISSFNTPLHFISEFINFYIIEYNISCLKFQVSSLKEQTKNWKRLKNFLKKAQEKLLMRHVQIFSRWITILVKCISYFGISLWSTCILRTLTWIWFWDHCAWPQLNFLQWLHRILTLTCVTRWRLLFIHLQRVKQFEFWGNSILHWCIS